MSAIPHELVAKMGARRGTVNAFEALEPAETALVVIDLDVASQVLEPQTFCRFLGDVRPGGQVMGPLARTPAGAAAGSSR